MKAQAAAKFGANWEAIYNPSTATRSACATATRTSTVPARVRGGYAGKALRQGQ